MRSVWGFLAFLSLSVAVHAGILVTLPQGGTAGQGAGGEDTLSMTASSAYSTLIEAWDRSPEAAQQPVLPTPVLEAGFAAAPSTDAAIQRPNRPDLAAQWQDIPPIPGVTPAPVPNLASVQPLAAPSLSVPNLPGLDPTGSIASSSPRPAPGLAPTLAMPDTEQSAPSAETEPHFEGSTALAAAISPRPGPRPEGLAPEPARTPAAAPQPSPAAPDRSAAGTGGGTTQGAAAAPAPQPTASAAQIQSLIGQWGGQIQARIARSRPNVNATGRAVVQLAITPNGQLVGLGIAASSGNPTIDQAALDAVRRAGRFPRAPAGLADASYAFSVPLTFQ